MTFVLPLPIHNSLQPKRNFKASIYAQRLTSDTDEKSLRMAQRSLSRTKSPASIVSVVSLPGLSWYKDRESVSPKVASRSLPDLVQEINSFSQHRQASSQVPDNDSWHLSTSREFVKERYPRGKQKRTEATYIPPRASIPQIKIPDATDMQSVPDVDSGLDRTKPEPLHIAESELILGEHNGARSGLQSTSLVRWLTTLRKRNVHQNTGPSLGCDDSTFTSEPNNQWKTQSQGKIAKNGHKRSLSLSSSLGFVTTVKSASITIASASIVPQSHRRNLSGVTKREKRSSDFSDTRMSYESNHLGALMEEDAWKRAVQRRHILGELVSSEESYISDMKALFNVYFTILASAPSVTSTSRNLYQRAVTGILQLHEDLLRDLNKVIPNSDHTMQDEISRPIAKATKHLHAYIAESVSPTPLSSKNTRLLFRRSVDICPSCVRQKGLADILTVMNVAKVFDKFMRRFLAYEAFAAQRDSMDRDATSISKTIEDWTTFERGLETLSRSIASIISRDATGRKGLTFSDLLIKPIQRVCKYPLFFNDLCKQTPACDDPVAHAELQKVLFRLEETIREINRAQDNPSTRKLIEITWRLQDRLVFKDTKEPSKSALLRLLGRIQLCGALHVAYETNERITGQYMICILYRSCLLLATANKTFSSYVVNAVISLLNARIEEPDNGIGLQCHTAPFTWKLVFESNRREYEIILSACSEKEEEEWKDRLKARIAAEAHDYIECCLSAGEIVTLLNLGIKSLDPRLGPSHSLTRRRSIQRAATVFPKPNLRQVIIKHTCAQKENATGNEVDPPILRSQSHLSSNNIPILAPRRAERSRLESALSDVWSKDTLPYPGMGTWRAENAIRASANSVMRKLSMVSIASNFSKRSASFTSIGSQLAEETCLSFQNSVVPVQVKQPKHSVGFENKLGPAFVDCHNVPDNFLPEDFSLKPEPQGKRRIFLTRTGRGLQTPRLHLSALSNPQSQKASKPLPSVENYSPGHVQDNLNSTADRKQDAWMEKGIAARKPTFPPNKASMPTNVPSKRLYKPRNHLLKFLTRLERPATLQIS